MTIDSCYSRHCEVLLNRNNPADIERITMSGYLYILFSKRNGTLYVGVTSNLIKRIYEHKNKVVAGFTKKYGVDKLGYYEIYEDIENAIIREKKLKNSSRKKKLELIEKNNPDWIDLYDEIIQ